ncbi:S8 family serine peptidase [Luteibacter aegosomatissinici]|uniref:S8 family serine peptidase n=1 Tax=Luteibacter aegosomatissinici TaxID=2911539 RepID=UPI001FF82FAE|nr:S8 family serine peptidase [Luteibacter aegosomatissinici]UPG96118.1 S8 family serine peptidase [Luteibacter aegosomatissinici]
MFTLRTTRACALAAAILLAMPSAYAADSTTMSATINLRSLQARPQQRIDRFIVTYRNGTTENVDASAAAQSVRAAVSRAGMDRAARSALGASVPGIAVSHVRRLAIGAHVLRTSRKLDTSEATRLMQQIATDPAVAHVEADVMMQPVRDIASGRIVSASALLSSTPNDPKYADYQWHFKAPTASAPGTSNVEKGWTVADGAGITVAVLDTGITQHPDLDLSLADAGYDFIDDAFVSGRTTDGRVAGGWDLGDWTTGDAYAECRDAGDPGEASSWHGTHVSGTISELTDNGVGMAGAAHAARVLPVRVLGHCGGYTSDIADAITWASGGHVDGIADNANPAQVISMSLGGGGVCTASDVTGTAIAGAIARGTTVVVAAGNSGADVANFSPASCPGVISVASNGYTGKRAFYSNYGTGVTISAPGGGIYANDASSGTQNVPDGFVWSTINLSATTPGDAGYGGMAGTSQATPHVSGIVAMMLGAEKALGQPLSTPDQVKDLLVSTARPFPVSEDHPIGAGIVDAYAAVEKAVSGPDDGGGSGDAVPLTVNVALAGQSGAAGASTLYAITVPAGAKTLTLRSFGGSGDVSLYAKAGSAPNENGGNADVASTRPGTTESAVVRSPATTTYYLRISGVTAYSGVSVLASYTL